MLLAGVALAVANRERLDAAAVELWVQEAGIWAPLAFVALYALAAVLFMPGSVLTLAGGALFGPLWGTLYNLAGATLGATLAFLAARYLAADWVARRAGGRVRRLVAGVEAEGWRFVAFVRLVPLFPFNLLNYALGLTRIRTLSYAVATLVFMAPAAIAYTYVGYAGREALAGGEGMLRKALLALGLLAAVAFLPRLVARLRRRPVLDVASLKNLLDGGRVRVVDVRSAEEFGVGHIPGSKNLPMARFDPHAAFLEDWRERPVAILGGSDAEAQNAVRQLAEAGFTDVQAVGGGIAAWRREGFPLER